MHILVTGGAGYIGSHVVKEILCSQSHAKITIIDNLSTGFVQTVDTLKNIAKERSKKLTFIEASLSNWDMIWGIFKSEKFDVIIHFAASLVVPESVSNPLKYYLNNTANTANLIRLAQICGVKKFIFSSTAAVYGEPSIDKVPVSEESPVLPINPYGFSKLFSEQILIDSSKVNSGFKYVILRYFNVAGGDVDGLIGQSTLNATHLIKVACETALGKREKMYIFGDDYNTADGTCIRDYIHVQDLALAHIEALKCESSEIFNCGYGYGFSVKEVINTVKKVSGVDFKTEIVDKRAGDPAILIANSDKLQKLTNWRPKYNSLELICKSALEWEKKI